MLEHLEASKAKLEEHYCAHYANSTPPRDSRPASSQTIVIPAPLSPQKVDFTSRYRKTQRAYLDELEEYFKLPQEDFLVCNPIKWWVGHRAQFSNLSQLAHDILSIPGLY
jgi:hypothetical protein